eukprot:Filipodium_phascolosomae@DN7071_c0_g1_i1.p1
MISALNSNHDNSPDSRFRMGSCGTSRIPSKNIPSFNELLQISRRAALFEFSSPPINDSKCETGWKQEISTGQLATKLNLLFGDDPDQNPPLLSATKEQGSNEGVRSEAMNKKNDKSCILPPVKKVRYNSSRTHSPNLPSPEMSDQLRLPPIPYD